MDHQLFDDLTRMAALPYGRRQIMRAFVLAWFGSLLASGRSRAVQAECPDGCDDDEVCQDGHCRQTCEFDRNCRSKKDDPCVLKLCLNGFCDEAIIDCLPGFECCDGECCAKSCTDDEECAVYDPCRIGTCTEGVCTFSELDPCLTCASDEECVNAAPNVICCEGTCRTPCPEGTLLSKGCECQADRSAEIHGIVVRDDASGTDGNRASPAQPTETSP